MKMDTPLLLIAWRRPHTLRQVIDAIRPAAPSRIFVACDGPNRDRPGEVEKVLATRAVISNAIDWPCQLQYYYSDINQGCRLGVSLAITWFFNHVEEGIILEDDCVPHPDFLQFCAELLSLYRNDERIFQISGFNMTPKRNSDSTYLFSEYGSIWGWATWRRAWNFFDHDLSVALASGQLQLAIDGLELWEKPDRRRNQVRLIQNGFDTWDYQWFFARLMQRGISICPSINLIQNVGMRDDATHSFDNSSISCLPVSEQRLSFPIKVDQFRVIDYKHDRLLLAKKFPDPGIIKRFRMFLLKTLRCFFAREQ